MNAGAGSTALRDDWKDAWHRDVGGVLTALDRLDGVAAQMEAECRDNPCAHSWGIRFAVREIREALDA